MSAADVQSSKPSNLFKPPPSHPTKYELSDSISKDRPSDPSKAASDTSATADKSTLSTIAETKIIPTLEESPPTRYLQSFIMLSTVVASLAYLAYIWEFDIFQTTGQQAAIMGSVVFALFYTGVVWIDWWEVVVGYWWLSAPLVGGAFLMIARMEEEATGIKDAD